MYGQFQIGFWKLSKTKLSTDRTMTDKSILVLSRNGRYHGRSKFNVAVTFRRASFSIDGVSFLSEYLENDT